MELTDREACPTRFYRFAPDSLRIRAEFRPGRLRHDICCLRYGRWFSSKGLTLAPKGRGEAMIRTVRGDEKQEPTTYMIVGRFSEVGDAHLMLGRTRVVLPAPLTPDGLTIGEILTVCAHRNGGDYVAETLSPGFPARRS